MSRDLHLLKNNTNEDQRKFLLSLASYYPFSQNYKNSGAEKLPPEFYCELDEKYPLTFFSGSFNPWHQGHEECLRQVYTLEKNIVVMPDYSPWKENIIDKPIDELLKLANHLRKKFLNINLYPCIWAQDRRNPTSDFVEKINWDSGIHWIMGEDTFSGLLRWSRSDLFLSKIKKIYICPRSLSAQMRSEFEQTKSELTKKYKNLELIMLSHHEFEDLSSTLLRKE